MKTTHIINSLKMLKRWARQYIFSIQTQYYTGMMPRGDGATMAWESEVNYWETVTTEDFLDEYVPIYDKLITEIEKT